MPSSQIPSLVDSFEHLQVTPRARKPSHFKPSRSTAWKDGSNRPTRRRGGYQVVYDRGRKVNYQRFISGYSPPLKSIKDQSAHHQWSYAKSELDSSAVSSSVSSSRGWSLKAGPSSSPFTNPQLFSQDFEDHYKSEKHPSFENHLRHRTHSFTERPRYFEEDPHFEGIATFDSHPVLRGRSPYRRPPSNISILPAKSPAETGKVTTGSPSIDYRPRLSCAAEQRPQSALAIGKVVTTPKKAKSSDEPAYFISNKRIDYSPDEHNHVDEHVQQRWLRQST